MGVGARGAVTARGRARRRRVARRLLAVTLVVVLLGSCFTAGYATWTVPSPVGGALTQLVVQVLLLVLTWYGGAWVADLTLRLWRDEVATGDDDGDDA